MVSEADLHAFHFARIVNLAQTVQPSSSSSSPTAALPSAEPSHAKRIRGKGRKSAPVLKDDSSRRTALPSTPQTAKRAKKSRHSLPEHSKTSASFRIIPADKVIHLDPEGGHGSISIDADKNLAFSQLSSKSLDSSALPPPSPILPAVDAGPSTATFTTEPEPITETATGAKGFVTPKKKRKAREPESSQTGDGYDQLLSSSLPVRQEQDTDMSETSQLVPSSPQLFSSPLQHVTPKHSKVKEKEKKKSGRKSKAASAEGAVRETAGASPVEKAAGGGSAQENGTNGNVVSTPAGTTTKRKKRESEGGKSEKKKRGKPGPSWVVETPQAS